MMFVTTVCCDGVTRSMIGRLKEAAGHSTSAGEVLMKSGSSRWFLSVVVAVCACATPAQAQFQISLPNVGLGQQTSVDEINRMVTSGLDSIPRNFGSDPADEERKIALAEAQLKKANDAITPAHKLDGRFGAVEENRALLERQIRVAKLANACSKALDAIRKSHDKGTLATDAQFKALATATTALEGAKAQGFEPIVAFFQQQGVDLKAQNAAVAARGAQQAAEREAQANRERSQGVLTALQQKEEALHAWLTANPQGAIPADLLAQFDAAVAAAKTNKAPVGWYERQQVQLNVANGFRLDDQAAFAAVAKALSGELVASGFNKQKAFSTKFNVKKDYCYLAVMRFGTASGTERLENLTFHGPSANTGVQEFYVSPRSEVWESMRGVCATQAGAVTVDGDATFAGTKNGIRFAVVAWPRAEVPAYVTQQVNVVAGDLCDTQAWKNLWTNPVPGSLVYVGNEPYLVSSTSQGWSDLWTATALGDVNYKLPPTTTTSPLELPTSSAS